MKRSSRHCGGAIPMPRRKPCASTSIKSPGSFSTRRTPLLMDETLRQQHANALGQLEALIRRGREIKNTRAADAIRAWQQDCAAAINQLSGGSKAHWLARAYSGAFLVRTAQGGVVVEADATEIVDRILGVLAQGATSLSRMDDVVASAGAAPPPRRFDFVLNAELRPVLEQTFADSRAAFARGEFGLALILSCGASVSRASMTPHDRISRAAFARGEFGLALILSCGVIDALLTVALDHARLRAHDAPNSFETRIAAAE